MKVVGINGSARKNGNTYLIINAIFEELKKENILTEQIQLFDKTINSCKGCFACKGKAQCIFEEDDFRSCFSALLTADGIILGSPVYSADVSSKMKAFLERAGVIVATNPHLLAHKVGACVVAVRRGGGLNTVDTLNHFLLNKEVILIGSTYWNMVYGKDIGDVYNDDEGMANMKNLGQNILWTMKEIHR